MKRLIKANTMRQTLASLASRLALSLALVVSLLPSPTSAAYIGSQYQVKDSSSYPVGSLIALDDQGQLTLASQAQSGYFGVVAKTDTSSNTIVVATEGQSVPILVTDSQGPIKSGQRLGLSDLAGVAAQWQPGQPVVGVAKAAPTNWRQVDTTKPDQTTDSARLALVEAQLVKTNPSLHDSQGNSYVGALQQAANHVAGHSVSLWQVIVALLIGLGGLILSLGLLLISSRESFFAVGRNPLASNTIMSSLWKMSAVSVGIMFISLTAAYLMLRLG